MNFQPRSAAALMLLFVLLALFPIQPLGGQSTPRGDRGATQQAQEIKEQFLRQAIELESWDQDAEDLRAFQKEMALEVAIALQVDDVYQTWMHEGTDAERRRYRTAAAQFAAKYGRPELARRILKQMQDSPAKIHAMSRIAFAHGYEGGNMQFEALLGELGAVGEALGHDPNQEARWQEILRFAYYCGAAASGRPEADETTGVISRVLYRDTVRGFRVQRLILDGNLQSALNALQTMESQALRERMLHLLLAQRTPRQLAAADRQEIGKRLFEEFSARPKLSPAEVADLEKWATLDVESERSPAGIPDSAYELVTDVFGSRITRPDVASVFEDCNRSGFCDDGLAHAMAISDSKLRCDWIACCLMQLEQAGQLEEAWAAYQRYKDELDPRVSRDEQQPNPFNRAIDGDEPVTNSDAFLSQLILSACRRGNFELAQSWIAHIENAKSKDDAIFTLAAFRQNEEDWAVIRDRKPTILGDFQSQLASIQSGKRLLWLSSRINKLDERDYSILNDEILRQVEHYKDLEPHTHINMILLYANSSDDEFRRRFAAEQAAILGIPLDRRSKPVLALAEVLAELAPDGRTPGLPESERQRLLEKSLAIIRQLGPGFPPKPTDREISNLAVVYARAGDQAAIEQLVESMSDPQTKTTTLLNCAMEFPPVPIPLSRGQIYQERIEQGGFQPVGIF